VRVSPPLPAATEPAAAVDRQLALALSQVGSVGEVDVGAPGVGEAVPVQDLVVADVHALAALRPLEGEAKMPSHLAAEVDDGEFVFASRREFQGEADGLVRAHLSNPGDHLDRHSDIFLRLVERPGPVAAAAQDGGRGDRFCSEE
jgi:hypothetical protein